MYSREDKRAYTCYYAWTAWYAVVRCLSVCLSVRPSIRHTRVLCRNNKAHHQAISTEL